MAATVITASVIVYLAVQSQFRGEVDRSLRAAGDAASAALASGRLPPRPRSPAPPRLGGPLLVSRIVDSRGRTVAALGGGARIPSDPRFAAVARAQSAAFYSDVDSGGDHLRVYANHVPGGRAVITARTVDETDSVLQRLRWLLLMVAITGTAIAILLGRAVAGASLRPLQRLEDAAKHVASTRDLTRRIDAEGGDEVASLARQFNGMLDALEQSNAALEDSVTVQRQLIADASHELRTPITTLRTNIEVLHSVERLGAEDRLALLNEVESQLRDFSVLIEDIIELARGDDEASSTDPEAVAVTAIVTEAVAWAQRHWPQVDFDLHVEPLEVEGYPERLGRAFRNLLDNAAKWSGESRCVDVSVVGSAVSVRDHGPGVPPGDQARIFDRFYRSGEGRGLPGTGLGLAIVKQVADAHGAAVEVCDASGGGAEFIFRFPSD